MAEEEEEGKKENVNTSLEPLLFFSFSNVGERPGVGNPRISRILRVASRQARLKTASECRFPRKNGSSARDTDRTTAIFFLGINCQRNAIARSEHREEREEEEER